MNSQNNTQTNDRPKKSQLFTYLCILTGFFILLEISFFIECNQFYFSDFMDVTHQIHIPYRILPGIAFFIFAQSLLHVFYVTFIWLLTRSTLLLFPSWCNK